MMEPTLRAKFDKALVSTSQNDSGPIKSEKDKAESSASQKYNLKFDSSNSLPICVICSSNTKEMSYDIYTTFTGSSKCLLFDFITKTSNIMFERDKVWSNSLCRDCYMLVNVLDRAEEKFLTLKNEFLVMLNKNNNVTALCKRYIACQTQTDCVVPSKIEFCAINVKDEEVEFDDLSRGASPLPVSDSDDEPLAKNKDKAREEVFVPVKMSSPIKCEVEIPIEEM